MKKNTFLTSVLISVIIIMSIPINVYANNGAPLPFLPDKNGSTTNQNSIGSFAGDLGHTLNSHAPEIAFVVNAIFAIMFLIGVIRMGYALVTKTGMVLKGSTGVLIGIPIFVICIRLISIIFFTTNGPGVTLLTSDLLTLLIKIGFYAAIGMVLVGLVMRLFFKFLNHPEYGRWSKNLFLGSCLLTLLTAIMPVVLQGI